MSCGSSSLTVNEIFYSLQGEGARAGEASIFVRLSSCNLSCRFCDTEFDSGKSYTLEQIYEVIKKYPSKHIVWTGGEPLMQLKKEYIDYFRNLGYFNCLETNGSVRIFSGFDYIAVSPKVAEHVLEKNTEEVLVDELRYVRNVTQTLPNPRVKAKHYFVSPEFSGQYLLYENLKHCVELVLKNPHWKLSLQYHKILGVR